MQHQSTTDELIQHILSGRADELSVLARLGDDLNLPNSAGMTPAKAGCHEHQLLRAQAPVCERSLCHSRAVGLCQPEISAPALYAGCNSRSNNEKGR